MHRDTIYHPPPHALFRGRKGNKEDQSTVASRELRWDFDAGSDARTPINMLFGLDLLRLFGERNSQPVPFPASAEHLTFSLFIYLAHEIFKSRRYDQLCWKHYTRLISAVILRDKIESNSAFEYGRSLSLLIPLPF